MSCIIYSRYIWHYIYRERGETCMHFLNRYEAMMCLKSMPCKHITNTNLQGSYWLYWKLCYLASQKLPYAWKILNHDHATRSPSYIFQLATSQAQSRHCIQCLGVKKLNLVGLLSTIPWKRKQKTPKKHWPELLDVYMVASHCTLM